MLKLCIRPDVAGWALDFRAHDLARALKPLGWQTDIIPKRKFAAPDPMNYHHITVMHPSSGPGDSVTFTNPTLVCKETFQSYPGMTHIVCPNPEMALDCLKLNHPSVHIPNLVNTDLFKLGVKNSFRDKPCIGIVAKRILIKGYGYWDILKSKLPEYEFCALDVKYDDNVIPRTEMPAFYQSLDLLLILSDYEAGPNSLGEALACGIPVISTKVGMSVSVLDGTCGQTVDRNVEEIAQAIVHTLSLKIEPEICRAKVFEYRMDLESGAQLWDDFLRTKIRNTVRK